MQNKIRGFSGKQKSQKKETKILLSSLDRLLNQSKDEAHKSLKTIQDLESSIVEKERLISDLSATHTACRDILSDYQKTKERWVIELTLV